MSSSWSLGVPVPSDFPVDPYDKVASLHAQIPYGGEDGWRRGPVEQLRAGWTGVGFRYLAMASWDHEWRSSVESDGTAPAMPIRVIQEASLFAFFAAACAVVEASCYAINAARVIAVGDSDGLTPERQRDVNPGFTAKMLRRSFPHVPVTSELRSLLGSDEYGRISQIRNVLSHRSAPPRLLFATAAGIDLTRPAEWSLSIHGYDGEPLTRSTTARPRLWLGPAPGRVTEAFSEFLRPLTVET